MELLDTTAAVDTPERVRFRYRLAGPAQRAVAWLIDLCLRLVVLTIVVTFVFLIGLATASEGAIGLLLLAAFLLEWFYGVFFETVLAGRTPGKIVLSLRVVRVDGSPAQLPDFLLRNLLRGADFLPMGYGAGVLTMVIDGRMRRIGDLVAGTVVVVEERSQVLRNVEIDPPVSESERQSMPARVDLSRDELTLIEAFLRRRPRLSDERAEQLATYFGPTLSERTGLEADTWERVLSLAYARHTGKDR